MLVQQTAPAGLFERRERSVMGNTRFIEGYDPKLVNPRASQKYFSKSILGSIVMPAFAVLKMRRNRVETTG